MLQGIQRRQVNCVSERDGVLLPEGVCRRERPLEEQVCLPQAACHNSLPQTAHHARNSLHSPPDHALNSLHSPDHARDSLQSPPDPAEAAETRLSSPAPVEEAATTIWRIGDWGLVGLFCLFPLFKGTASPDYKCLRGTSLKRI
jgi:hypothetical protein